MEEIELVLLVDCKKYLGFDDRLLMLIGIPVMSVAMPFMLEFNPDHDILPKHLQIIHSLFHVSVFWIAYRNAEIYLHKIYPSFQDSIKRNLLQIVIVLISAPLLKVALNYSIDFVLNGFLPCPPEILPSNIANILRIYFPCLLILSLYEGFFYFNKYKEQFIRNERLEKMHVQSQLAQLRNQVNPHFLFNSLNVLMNLIPVQPDAAMGFLDKLSRFYRHTVNLKDEKLSPIIQELEMAKLYAELLEVRFRDALNFNFPDMQHSTAKVIPMSLQLLIENAIKHNIVSRSEPLCIDIEITEDHSMLIVCNKLQPKLEAVTSTGIGLSNIRERLAFYTDKELEIDQNEEQFCVRLPLIK